MTRSGFAAILGAPNAGKSTLVNALVGAKVTIVTHKPQTTRFAVRGVVIEDESQIVLVDTPGVFAPRRRLDRSMVRAAWRALEDADAIVLVVDAAAEARAVEQDTAKGADRLAHADAERALEGLARSGRSAFLALNKIDAMAPPALLPLARSLADRAPFAQVFMISALTGEGVGDLKRVLARAMPEGPWLYPADQIADLPQRLLAAEITREKVWLRVHQELPYETGIETTAFEARPDGSFRLEQTIFVARESQRPILIGRAGRTLKAIGQAARAELAQALGGPTHLFLAVKVRRAWADDRAWYREVGLDYDA